LSTDEPNGPETPEDGNGDRVVDLPIEDELKQSYMTYAMSVIVSRALPDVRDGQAVAAANLGRDERSQFEPRRIAGQMREDLGRYER